jgi:hypothetical protein
MCATNKNKRNDYAYFKISETSGPRKSRSTFFRQSLGVVVPPTMFPLFLRSSPTICSPLQIICPCSLFSCSTSRLRGSSYCCHCVTLFLPCSNEKTFPFRVFPFTFPQVRPHRRTLPPEGPFRLMRSRPSDSRGKIGDRKC